MRTQRDKIGALFAIDLGNGQFAFGRRVSKAESVFYDYVTNEISPNTIKKAYESKIAFRTSAYKYAITSGRWEIVDSKEPLPPDLAKPKKYFIQDSITGSFSIYFDGDISPCTASDIEGLECCAVWEPEHIEDRLRDHFAGRPNIWVESLKPKIFN